jgi:hypothetical protein
MKTILSLCLLIFVGGCTKEEEVPQKLNLNGTFVGKITGWAQPMPINGTATWTVVHTGNEITASIVYNSDVVGFNIPKYKGTVVNDTTLIGGFIEIATTSIVNGKISKDGNHITCATASNDPSINYVRVAFDLTKK